MARLTLDELTQPLSREQAQASIYAVLARLDVNTTSWKPDAAVRTIIVGVSSVFAAYTELMALIARSGFLALSSGDWLTLVAWHVYGIERRPATFASGTLTLTNSGGGLYILDAGDLIVRNVTTGATYNNTGPLTLKPNSEITTGIAATESGAGGSAAAHDINALVTTLLGVTCENAAALTGTDVEPDSTLRLRCSEMLGARSPMGPWDAYSSALRNATDPTGRNLGITRVALLPDGYGRIDAYCATSTRALPVTDVPYAQTAVNAWAVPFGVTCIVNPAVEVIVTVLGTAYAHAAESELPDLEAAVSAALGRHLQARAVGGDPPPDGSASGGFVYLDGLASAAAEADPRIFHVALSVPSADVPMPPNSVAVAGVLHVVVQRPDV